MLDRRSHPSAHPLPPLRLAQTPVYVDRGYCPGGRWERILRTIHDQPLTETEILRAVHDGRYPRRIERRKIHAALIAMTRQGLTARLPGSPAPFTATAHGVRILHGEAA
ncbi:hypothetical protein [Brevundimonas sp. ZS04]|jgi:hypothetical protein|uniref:hypothetical protein n=1 Tax=Brevundimonas sp. ZS04 TaxID=1906854 RepID=UPI00096C7B99|nr:hypothetical protein [Brevundimonas sp. ZS04]OMG60244.1 hypothetical protein BJP32_03705 [Brevundimonas sp. ZS04]